MISTLKHLLGLAKEGVAMRLINRSLPGVGVICLAVGAMLLPTFVGSPAVGAGDTVAPSAQAGDSGKVGLFTGKDLTP